MKLSIACITRFHAFYLAEQMAKHGNLLSLFTSFYGNIGIKRNNFYKIPKHLIKTNMIAAFLAYDKLDLGKHSLLKYKYFGNWVANNLAEEDMVISWGLSALPIIQKASSKGIISVVERGSSHVLHQQEILMEEYKKSGLPTKELKKSFSDERINREMQEYKEANYITIPSLYVKRTFLEKGISEDKLIHVPYGTSLDQFSPQKKEDDTFRVIHCGGISLRKGVQYLLRAFYELKLPNAELWLVGSLNPEMKPFLAKYESDDIILKGHQPQNTLAWFYSQCSVFCLASIEEGLAMVQPQAMACGLPVIHTTNTGGEDIVRDGVDGFCIPIRDVEAIKEKILFFYENPEKREVMARSALKQSQNAFSWDKYGEKLIASYQHLTIK